MNNYIKFLDGITRLSRVKCTFTGTGDTFRIYAFVKDIDEVSPLDILAEINLLASKVGVCDFWMKKSIVSDKDDVYEDSDVFKEIYVFRVIDGAGNNVKFC